MGFRISDFGFRIYPHPLPLRGSLPLSRMRERGPGGEGHRLRLRAVLCSALLVLALVLLTLPLQGQAGVVRDPATEPVAREAMFRLRSPATPSHTLDMCPHGNAEALRDTIRLAAAEGQTVDQLVEGVIARYGEHMRLLPQRRGAGLWAWVLPPAVLLFGLGVVLLRLRALRAPPEEQAARAVGEDLTAEERARLEEALAELEETQEELR
jgi:cytochrome c-type biogenesis protein CcmH